MSAVAQVTQVTSIAPAVSELEGLLHSQRMACREHGIMSLTERRHHLKVLEQMLLDNQDANDRCQ